MPPKEETLKRVASLFVTVHNSLEELDSIEGYGEQN